ncbi:peptidyl-alpha-hydroxyglycine-alpha-amidating lyase-PA [Capsaspora owczarzaki ATCC 30864]|uniref:Peptidyl-alpha-hydroxyglycine-alpha-amidating lyase-PA n=1 Tax=Capsaspora owczarzaki (strain ATCC 30864) TaxID=595528 RepID=A0A0D2VNU4_CAPO3|nr:peptidyl-alpha-hydroxyglycine-alpha-amidating lyase-PA [Capsaspora owczarzaki ATCC 30864]KJE92042.1 peptidyl-alpha-hydroxyglycine-alpha-amidating lyase-PA [Capsaspora owczarzaki ATCC 30864]|eukprot:XP_004363913.2 peptidyl-alpha-hydroxyglycine-alpha-amidating lyase-PA [Capsaspora owczarzaki ATCC 30864]
MRGGRRSDVAKSASRSMPIISIIVIVMLMSAVVLVVVAVVPGNQAPGKHEGARARATAPTAAPPLLLPASLAHHGSGADTAAEMGAGENAAVAAAAGTADSTIADDDDAAAAVAAGTGNRDARRDLDIEDDDSLVLNPFSGVAFDQRPYMARKPLLMPGVTTTSDDTYLCTFAALPEEHDYFIHKFEPVANEHLVHHMMVYGCTTPYVDTGRPWGCANMNHVCGETGSHVLFSWAHGARAFTLPDNTGFHVGQFATIRTLVLQVHYAPIIHVPDFVTGVQLYLARATSASVFAGMLVMARSQLHLEYATDLVEAPLSCTFSSPAPITAFAFRVHAHGLGESISASVRSATTGALTVLGVGVPSNGSFVMLPEPITLSSNDVLEGYCRYNTSSLSPGQVVRVGTTFADEMCNFYLMFSSAVVDGTFLCESTPTFVDNSFVPDNPDASQSKCTAMRPCSQYTHMRECFIRLNKPCCCPIVDDSPETAARKHRGLYWDDSQQYVNVTSQMGLVNRWPNYFPVSGWEIDPADTSNGAPKPRDFASAASASLQVVASYASASVEAARASRSPIPAPPRWDEFIPPPFTLGQVTGLATDPHGNVWVLHRGDRIWDELTFDAQNNIRYDTPIMEDVLVCISASTGVRLSSWGGGFFYFPHGLQIDAAGNFWITDIGLHQVFKFGPAHEFPPLLTLGSRLQPGSGPGQFCKPADAGPTSSGTIVVADGYCNSRVVRFQSTGIFRDTKGIFGAIDGQDLPPAGMFHIPHSVTFDSKGNSYIADRENGRIQVLSEAGVFTHFYTEVVHATIDVGDGHPILELERQWRAVYSVRILPHTELLVAGVLDNPFGDRGRIVRIQIRDGEGDGLLLGSFGNVNDTDVFSPAYSVQIPHALATRVGLDSLFVADQRPSRLLRYEGFRTANDPVPDMAAIAANPDRHTKFVPGEDGVPPVNLHSYDCDRLQQAAVLLSDSELHLDCSCGIQIHSNHPQDCVSGWYCRPTAPLSVILGYTLDDGDSVVHSGVPVFVSRHRYDAQNPLFLTYSGVTPQSGMWYVHSTAGNRLYPSRGSYPVGAALKHQSAGSAYFFPVHFEGGGDASTTSVQVGPSGSNVCLPIDATSTSLAALASAASASLEAVSLDALSSRLNSRVPAPTSSRTTPVPRPTASLATRQPQDDANASGTPDSLSEALSSHRLLIIAGVVAGVAVIGCVIGTAVWLRRRHAQGKGIQQLYRSLRSKDVFDAGHVSSSDAESIAPHRRRHRSAHDDTDDDNMNTFRMKFLPQQRDKPRLHLHDESGDSDSELVPSSASSSQHQQRRNHAESEDDTGSSEFDSDDGASTDDFTDGEDVDENDESDPDDDEAAAGSNRPRSHRRPRSGASSRRHPDSQDKPSLFSNLLSKLW